MSGSAWLCGSGSDIMGKGWEQEWSDGQTGAGRVRRSNRRGRVRQSNRCGKGQTVKQAGVTLSNDYSNGRYIYYQVMNFCYIITTFEL